MVCLGLEPGVAEWKAQTNPLSYGGTPPPRIAKCCSQLRFVPVLHLVFLEEVKNMSELLYNRFHQQNLARKYNLSHT